jgi:hypothetical protein
MDVFRNGRFDLLALTETKLKGNGEGEWDGVKCVYAGVEKNERAREGVAILMSDLWFRSMVKFECVSPRILLVKFKFKKVKVCVVVSYGPSENSEEEEYMTFWNELNDVLDTVSLGFRMIVLGDLNGWIGDRKRDGVTGDFGVEGENENGKKVIDFCVDKGMCVCNTFFSHKNVHKYTRVGVDRDGNEVKSMIDLVLVKKEMLRYVLDVKSIRGLGMGISDHYVVLCKIRLVGVWMERKMDRKKVGRIKSEMLNEQSYRDKYERTLLSKSVVCEQNGIEQIWTHLKEALVNSAREICGSAKVGNRNVNSEIWCDEVKQAINRKKEAWLKVLQAKDEILKERYMEEYKEERRKTKKCINKRKKEVNEQFGRKMNGDVQGNRKLFWKEVKKIKKDNKVNLQKIMDRNGTFVTDDLDVRRVWREHFESLHNVGGSDEVIVNVCGFKGFKRNRYFGDEEITREEVVARVRKLKNGKSAGIDEITGEMIKNGGDRVIDWIWKLCNKVFVEGIVPKDWSKAVIVPLYKGKGDKGNCRNYRGISLLSVVGKIYAGILVERVRRVTEELIGEEQCAFRSGRGCIDQIFTLKQMSEKMKGKKKKLYLAFMDLQQAYDRVNREALWQVLMIYGVGGRLLNGIKSLYGDSEACVRINGVEGEWFKIESGVRQGCVMSPWLFNLYMDGVMKELMVGMGNEGVRMMENGREWKVPCLLYADDLALCSESEEGLQRLVEGFGRVCKRRGLKVNVDKSKVMVMNEERTRCQILLGDEQLEQVSEFKYLGYMLDEKGLDDVECGRKVSNGRKVSGAIKLMVNVKGLSLKCAKVLHESMLVPVLMYGSETMVWNPKYRSKMQAVQMDNLRGVLGIRRTDKVRNEYIRELCGVDKGINERINESMLRWFGHVERMDGDRLVKRIYSSECVGNRPVGRPKKRWIDSVKECLVERNVGLVEARRLARDRSEWRGFVRGYGCGPRPRDEPYT